MSYDIYTGLLKVFNLPTSDDTDVRFTYNNNHPKLNELKSIYSIASVTGDGDDLSRAISLLNWVSTHIYHKDKSSPYYRMKYEQISKRRGKIRAIIAIARMLLTAVFIC